LAYIDSAYVKKFGQRYPWSNLARKNLWNMARVHSAWGVMGLWDLYLASESWWAVQTTWSVYGMIGDSGRLLEGAGLKPLALKHQENLARQRFGQFSTTEEVLSSFGSRGNCGLHGLHKDCGLSTYLVEQ
jgi:hypothetical protein